MNLLQITGLTKKYGKITALDHLNLVVGEGMVFGLLGPNGSGKTTTLGLLLGVLKPTSGSFKWFGQEPSMGIRKKIGAILEKPCFYPYLSGEENLKIAARIKDCPISNTEEVLTLVGLSERKKDAYKTYSLGMKQRLAIASALIADPAVLILDEPTNGLDPQGIVGIRELIIRIAETGKSIILASHLLDEVQKICTHFMVLKNGVKLFQGSVRDALDNQRRIEVASADLPVLKESFRDFAGLESMNEQEDKLLLSTKEGVNSGDVNKFAIAKGIVLTHLVESSGTLEMEFLKILASHD